jgi:hypothetical protein
MLQTGIDEAITELEYIRNRCDAIHTPRLIKLSDECMKIEERIRNNTFSRDEILSSVELLMDKLNYLMETQNTHILASIQTV